MWTYTFQRFAKIKSLQAFSGPRMEWMARHITLVVFILAACGLVLCISLFFLSQQVILVMIPLAVASVLYVGKFPFRDLFNLRDVPYLKVHIISAVWAGTTVLLPVINSGVAISSRIWMISLVVYLLILALAITFDVRDLDVDEPSKKTVPQLVGKHGALALAALINISAIALTVRLSNELLVPMLIFMLCATAMIFFARRRPDDFYYSFWLDGLIILFGLSGFFI